MWRKMCNKGGQGSYSGVSLVGSQYYLLEDKIVSCDGNVSFLSRPMRRNVRTVFKLRVSYEHEKAPFIGIHLTSIPIVISSQGVTMAKSGRKFWFQSGIFIMVIILCAVCVCESRSRPRSSSTNEDGGIADTRIIDVPQRKTQTSCVNGRKPDKNGNCRNVW
jgi:hypothetical protein